MNSQNPILLGFSRHLLDFLLSQQSNEDVLSILEILIYFNLLEGNHLVYRQCNVQLFVRSDSTGMAKYMEIRSQY